MRSRFLKNVRCKNGCVVSNVGKVDLLFSFNYSVKQEHATSIIQKTVKLFMISSSKSPERISNLNLKVL